MHELDTYVRVGSGEVGEILGLVPATRRSRLGHKQQTYTDDGETLKRALIDGSMSSLLNEAIEHCPMNRPGRSLPPSISLAGSLIRSVIAIGSVIKRCS